MHRRVGITTGIVLAVVALSAGAAVLTTITIDGNMSDWSAVLADPLQTSFDGPSGPLPDLDAPVSTASLDITRFAWTYDSASFYFQVTRNTRSNGRSRFLLYLDTDFDGRMQSGEPVIELSWWGNARRTRTALHSYNAIDAAGDPLGDAAGSADGWSPPGSLSTGPTFLQAYGGSADRLQVETGVPWSLLGIAPGSPMHFHVVSATGTNFPDDVLDNMGGPGGRVGTTLFSGIDLSPPAVAGTVIASGIVPLSHVAANISAAADTINLSWSSSGSFTPSSVVFYNDVDADGLLSGTDVPLADTDGDALPDTGPLAPGASLPLLAVLQAPPAVVDGDSVTLRITASSSTAPSDQDTADDEVTVATPQVTLVKAVSDSDAPPGTVLVYSVDYLSNGNAGAYNVVIVDEVPAPAIYQTGSAVGPGALIEFSHDDGTSYDSSEALPVTHIRWSFPAAFAPGDAGQVSFEALIP